MVSLELSRSRNCSDANLLTLFLYASFRLMSAVTNPPTFIQDGRQINKGLEVSFAGDLVHSLHAIFSASFIDPKQRFTQDPTTEGKSASTIPGATERVYLSWDVSQFKGL